MSNDDYELMTVNSYFHNGFRPSEETEEETTKEEPLPEPEDMFETSDDHVVPPPPTTNEDGKETPLPEVEMDWESIGSDS